jgi:hypothetical protein
MPEQPDLMAALEASLRTDDVAVRCNVCLREFPSADHAVGHLDKRVPAHDGYRFCHGEPVSLAPPRTQPDREDT